VETETSHPPRVPRRVEAIVYQRHPDDDEQELAAAGHALADLGITLVVLDGAPIRSEDVATALDRLAADGIGAGLVGAVGDLPGLTDRVVTLGSGADALGRACVQQRRLRREGTVPVVDPDPLWTIEVSTVDPARRRIDEALLTLADGVFGTRGVLDERMPGEDPLVVCADCFADGTGEGVEATPRLIEAPLWTRVVIEPTGDDGREVSVPRRTLDLRSGVLVRDDGRVRVMRFACLHTSGTFLLRAEGPPEILRAGPTLEASTDGVGRMRDHPWGTSASSGAGPVIAAVGVTTTHDAPTHRSVERIAVYERGAHSSGLVEAARRRLEHALEVGFDEMLARHRAAWARRWRDADVVIDGDPQLQVAVRFCLFHVMSAAADDLGVVSARGLTGRAYRGHVFWDADVFVLPFLAATHPAAARAMLAFRQRGLPLARAAARAQARAGARFPWEADAAGRDVTPSRVIGPDGESIEILTGSLQEHITADVAWAASHYLAWTGDPRFARGPAQSLLFETARYWRSRVEVDRRAGTAHLRGVMGPDEYHAPVDDNAFTNAMVRWNLRRAALMVRPGAPVALRREADAWVGLAQAIVDGYDPSTGRHEQFAGFSALDDVQIAALVEPPVAADMLLGPERVAASQIIKQADVVMMHHLLPTAGPPASWERDLAHYLPRTAHGSSLSPGIHASALARCGRVDEAADLLRLTALIDLADVTGSTAGGIHLAAAASVWHALVFGFLGVWPERRGVLRIDPRLPTTWRGLTAHVRFRGQPVTIEAAHDVLRVHGTRPIRLRVAGRLVLLRPPRLVVERIRGAWRPRQE
jgi:trehalose/maltose hydrolase-like predicted phosphorylase